MALQQLPPKPNRNGSWDSWGDTVDANVRQLISDVPALAVAQSDVAARLARAETSLAQSTADVAAVRSDAASAQTTASSAASTAASARAAADTAQAAATKAAEDAATAAATAAGIGSRVTNTESAVTNLTTSKADRSSLATVALTGRYADLTGRPDPNAAPDLDAVPPGRAVHTNGAVRPTARTDLPVIFHTKTAPASVINLAAGDVWEPSAATATTPAVWL